MIHEREPSLRDHVRGQLRALDQPEDPPRLVAVATVVVSVPPEYAEWAEEWAREEIGQFLPSSVRVEDLHVEEDQ